MQQFSYYRKSKSKNIHKFRIWNTLSEFYVCQFIKIAIFTDSFIVTKFTMAEVIKIKKGLDIKMHGQAEKIYVKAPRAKTFAIKPVDWHGLTPKIIPKLCDPVKVGTPIFYDSNTVTKFLYFS